MKNLTICMILVLMVSSVGFGQNKPKEGTPEFTRTTSIKQQLAILNAGKDNPTQAQAVSRDERMSQHLVFSEAAYGPANDKASPLVQEEIRKPDRSIAEPSKDAQKSTVGGANNQPEAAIAEEVVNYRTLNSGNDQSPAAQSDNVIDLKKLPSGHEQSESQSPPK